MYDVIKCEVIMARSIVINLKIANRSYPLKIKSEEQEKNMRQAAKLINEKIEKYHKQYEVRDVQDVLSMISLDAVFNQINTNKSLGSQNDKLFLSHLFDISYFWWDCWCALFL